MTTCAFCKEELEKGTGMLFVKNDGKQLYFCSSKCRKNQLGLKRNPRKQNWVK